jgi:hypothetical protein
MNSYCCRDDILRHPVSTHEIDVDHLLNLFRGVLHERAHDPQSGVVEDYVDVAHLAQDLLRHGLYVGTVGHVALISGGIKLN